MTYRLCLTDSKEYEIIEIVSGRIFQVTEESSDSAMDALEIFKQDKIVLGSHLSQKWIVIMEHLDVLAEVQELDDFLRDCPEHFL